MKVSAAPEDHIHAWAGGNADTETLHTEAVKQLRTLIGRGRPNDVVKQLERVGGVGFGPFKGLRRGSCGPIMGGDTRRGHLR